MRTFVTKQGVAFSFAESLQDETLVSITDRNNHRVEIGLNDFLEFVENTIKDRAQQFVENTIKKQIENFSFAKLLKSNNKNSK